MSIGAVLAVLREEFPEVTISKIRFLEAEGLVEPQRTPSGYRKFGPDDVERLARVLRMQRDHYLPLKVIREHLDAQARGEDTGAPLPPEEPDGQPRRQPALELDRTEFLAATGIEDGELAAWEEYGLLGPGADGGYDADGITLARLIADLGRFGLEPRHLRAVKAAADRQAGLIEQVVAPLRRHRNPQTRAHADTTTHELVSLSLRLHAALVRSALREGPA